jgi:acyl-CoA synthetase (AMP-forming)/AMP-acid ligase II
MILMATTLHIPVIVMKSFVFEEYLRIIQEHKVTKLQVVPPIMIMLDKRPEALKYDLGSVKEILCGAAPLSRELQEVVSRKFNVRVTQAWGMTETTCCGVSNSPDGLNPPGSIGQIIPNTEIKLIDDDGVEVTAPNIRGEVFIRGPQVGLRYWRNSEASKDSFDKDGWFKTGDVAVINEKEYVWLVDRKKASGPYPFIVAQSESELLGTDQSQWTTSISCRTGGCSSGER